MVKICLILEIIEVLLVHCNIVTNRYQQNSRAFSQLLDISPTNFIFLKTFNSEFIEVWFKDQNFEPLEIEDKINITLFIN